MQRKEIDWDSLYKNPFPKINPRGHDLYEVTFLHGASTVGFYSRVMLDDMQDLTQTVNLLLPDVARVVLRLIEEHGPLYHPENTTTREFPYSPDFFSCYHEAKHLFDPEDVVGVPPRGKWADFKLLQRYLVQSLGLTSYTPPSKENAPSVLHQGAHKDWSYTLAGRADSLMIHVESPALSCSVMFDRYGERKVREQIIFESGDAKQMVCLRMSDAATPFKEVQEICVDTEEPINIPAPSYFINPREVTPWLLARDGR